MTNYEVKIQINKGGEVIAEGVNGKDGILWKGQICATSDQLRVASGEIQRRVNELMQPTKDE